MAALVDALGALADGVSLGEMGVGQRSVVAADTEGWRDWTGRFISDRTAEEQDDLDRLLSIDTTRWHQEMTHRDEHLAQFPGLPHAIRDIHARITASLDRR